MSLYPVDLHTHTTASDGLYSPGQLIERAAERGLRVVGIADHDTIDGLAEAQTAGQKYGVEIAPAVEFSTRHEVDKDFVGIHILGYFIDVASPGLTDVIGKVKQGRIDQKIRQIEKLQSFGFDIPVKAVFDRVQGVPGRPHIAAVLMERNPGRFATVQQIFDEYLGGGARAHVGRQFALTVGQAIAVVKDAGGLPVLAHPAGYGSQIDPIIVVRNAKAEGVEGVEVYYPYQRSVRLQAALSANDSGQPGRGAIDWVYRIQKLADELGLLQTGGTDFHGRPQDGAELGDVGLSQEQFAQLKQGWQNLRHINKF